MPELRQDTTTKERASIAVERAKRPGQFRKEAIGDRLAARQLESLSA